MVLAPGLPAALPTAEQEPLALEGFAETQPFGAGLHMCLRNSSKGNYSARKPELSTHIHSEIHAIQQKLKKWQGVRVLSIS